MSVKVLVMNHSDACQGGGGGFFVPARFLRDKTGGRARTCRSDVARPGACRRLRGVIEAKETHFLVLPNVKSGNCQWGPSAGNRGPLHKMGLL